MEIRNKWVIISPTFVVACAAIVFLALHSPAPEQQPELSGVGPEDELADVTPKAESSDAVVASKVDAADAAFENESEALALYRKMIEAMRNAESLSYTSNFWRERKGRETGRGAYTIWMKKPNHFCLETVNRSGQKGGTLVGDGDYLWIHWPKDRPWRSSEDRESYEKSRSNVYMKKATPIGRHSIGHEVGSLGVSLATVIDPSIFHGYTDSLEPYLDGAMGMGTEKVGDEVCDVIEVSFMKHQRSWYLWLSKQDYLPRKSKDVVRLGGYDNITHERWMEVTIDAEMPAEKFAWKPPEGWRQWHPPNPDERLLKPGQEAPDFELASAGEGKISLSEYRGKVVWFYLWKAG